MGLNEERTVKTLAGLTGAGVRLAGDLLCPKCLVESLKLCPVTPVECLSAASLVVDETEYIHNLLYFANEKTGEAPNYLIPWDERFNDILSLSNNMRNSIEGIKLLRKINNDWRLAAYYNEQYKITKNPEYLEKVGKLTIHSKDVAKYAKGLISTVNHYLGEGTLKATTNFALNFEVGYSRSVYDRAVLLKILQRRLNEGKLSYEDFNRYIYLNLDSDLALYSTFIETRESYRDVVGSSFISYILLQGDSVSVYQNIDKTLDILEKVIEHDLEQYERMINFLEKETEKSLIRIGKTYTKKSFNKNELMNQIKAIRTETIKWEDIEREVKETLTSVAVTPNFHITYNENSPDKEAASKIMKAEKTPAEAKQIAIKVLVGGPLANAETAKYQDYFPVKVTNLYPGKNKGVIEVINNPDGEGKIVLLAGSDRNGTKAAVEIYSQLDRLPDKPMIVEWKDGKAIVIE